MIKTPLLMPRSCVDIIQISKYKPIIERTLLSLTRALDTFLVIPPPFGKIPPIFRKSARFSHTDL